MEGIEKIQTELLEIKNTMDYVLGFSRETELIGGAGE